MNFEIVTTVILLAGFAVLGYLLIRKPKKDDTRELLLEWLKDMRGTTESLQKRIDETNKTLSDRLGETNKAINERLDNAAKVIGSVKKDLGEMSEIGKSMRGIQEFLASPKRRGGMGEEVLTSILEQYFPHDQFELQYRFKSGSTVDAVLKIQSRFLPIDSKFPMENYRKFLDLENESERDKARRAFINDIRQRIREISSKYILPEEGTMDYAMMYVPSEAVFYDIITDADLRDYAREHRVYVTSPNSFAHHLQGVLLSLRGQKIQEAAHQILKVISAIKQESEKFGRNLEVLSRHVTNAKNSADNLNTDYVQLKGKIDQVANLRIDAPENPEDEKLLEQ